MKGLHRILNTKEDYEYIKSNEPKSVWKPAWQALLDGLYAWQTIGLDESGSDYEESYIRVVDAEEGSTVTQVWKIDPHCKLYRLGFTVEDVEAAMQNGY